jgi:hypothetical protein
MSAANKTSAILALGLALAACGGGEAEQHDAANNSAAISDIDTLPADESVTTPSDELANGAAEPQGNTAEVEP